MRKNNIVLPISLLFVLALTGCNRNTSQPLTSSEGDSTVTSSESSGGTTTSTSSSTLVEASFEVTSNMASTPTLDFQDSKYYVGDAVRFKVAESKYNIDSVTANGNALVKGDGLYPYSFIALENNTIHLTLSIQHATTPKDLTLTFGSGVDNVTEQIYNFWPENSGVAYDISTRATEYTISYELSIDTHLIDDSGNNISGLGYGSNDEIQINIPMFFSTVVDGTANKSYGFNMKLFKYGSLWVYRPLHGVETATKIWTGTRAFDDHRDDALARNITKALSRGGVKFVYSFNEETVTATAEINGVVNNIGTCDALAIWNGKDNGNNQLRYMDFNGQFSTALTDEIKLTASNFVVDYAVE